ncbi:4-dihydrotrisporin dehydrogenase [Endogone sp. FLAS-F59071]|nr:4-dihydrotrisporin dehydrogenase [Endogone sp. FLAS-F59071]|eukprot:RUS15739.1 4-dihydrotrisporin dehydrogenase [Endogone sp. FLAS-F59071]
MAQSSLTFLITGASRGLGLEFVRQLSQKNHTILAGVRSPAHADELQIISSTFSNVHVFQIDTADDQSIKAAVGEVERLSPAGIDILINKRGGREFDDNVGYIKLLSPETIVDPYINSSKNFMVRNVYRPKEDLEQVFTTNVAGTLIATNAFLPALLKRPTRKIINISSNLGSITRTWAGVKTSYKVSKAALNMLTRCYALDLLSEKFTVLALHPGWVQTDMGGKNASISPPESISGMLQVIEKVTAADSGKFLDYQGSSLPW